MANFLLIGTISGCLSAISFILIHRILIADIWFITIPAIFLGALTGLGLAWSYQILYDQFYGYRLFVLMITYGIPVIIIEFLTIFLYEKKYSFDQLTTLNSSLILQIAILPLIPIVIIFGFLVGKYSLTGTLESYILSFVTCGIIMLGIGHNVAILNSLTINNSNEYMRFKLIEYSQIIVPFITFLFSMFIFDYLKLIELPINQSGI